MASKIDFITELPEELSLLILSYEGIHTGPSSEVNSTWHRIARDPLMWIQTTYNYSQHSSISNQQIVRFEISKHPHDHEKTLRLIFTFFHYGMQSLLSIFNACSPEPIETFRGMLPPNCSAKVICAQYRDKYFPENSNTSPLPPYPPSYGRSIIETIKTYGDYFTQYVNNREYNLYRDIACAGDSNILGALLFADKELHHKSDSLQEAVIDVVDINFQNNALIDICKTSHETCFRLLAYFIHHMPNGYRNRLNKITRIFKECCQNGWAASIKELIGIVEYFDIIFIAKEESQSNDSLFMHFDKNNRPTTAHLECLKIVSAYPEFTENDLWQKLIPLLVNFELFSDELASEWLSWIIDHPKFHTIPKDKLCLFLHDSDQPRKGRILIKTPSFDKVPVNIFKAIFRKSREKKRKDLLDLLKEKPQYTLIKHYKKAHRDLISF